MYKNPIVANNVDRDDAAHEILNVCRDHFLPVDLVGKIHSLRRYSASSQHEIISAICRRLSDECKLSRVGARYRHTAPLSRVTVKARTFDRLVVAGIGGWQPSGEIRNADGTVSFLVTDEVMAAIGANDTDAYMRSYLKAWGK